MMWGPKEVAMSNKREAGSEEPPLMDGNVFEYLMCLNQKVEGAIELLRRLSSYPALNKESFIIFQTYFREYLADANLRVICAIEESEEEVMREIGWTRAAYEKKLHDPDDCYIDVVRREEELRMQGRPSQLGILFGMRKAEVVGNQLDEDEEGESDSEVHSDQPGR
jgi:hypothetical protein